MAKQPPRDGRREPEPVFAAAVYVETSVLRQLPADLASPALARLNDVVARFAIEKFVPAIVRDEWVVAHQDAARKKRQDMMSAAHALGEYLGERAARAEVPDAETVDREVNRVQVERLGAAGFIEVPTPTADVNELLHLAARHVKPFAEEDRGFRDAMIARTIAEHAKQFPSDEIVIISRDEVFHHPDVKRQWEAVGVTPVVVRSFEEAAACLEAGLDAAVREHMESEIARIEAFLKSRQEGIFAQLLRGVEVSEGFIRGGPLQDQAYYGALERVRAVRPVGITNISFGHVLQRSLKREGPRRPVTFFVKVAFDITVRQIPLSLERLAGGGGPKIRLDAVDLPVATGGGFSFADFLAPPREEISADLRVEREIPVEAWVTEDEETGELVEVDIEKITTW
jgi:hypothetical protein